MAGSTVLRLRAPLLAGGPFHLPANRAKVSYEVTIPRWPAAEVSCRLMTTTEAGSKQATKFPQFSSALLCAGSAHRTLPILAPNARSALASMPSLAGVLLPWLKPVGSCYSVSSIQRPISAVKADVLASNARQPGIVLGCASHLDADAIHSLVTRSACCG